ncbi:PLP-dependent aminotransferase family protein [Oscillatoria sp. FACHB-1406]|uniref:aminotransferase-like domain-containing protein n=1 Tax=Oscillatoria sp. FACHB-1406 TaxID=2692846 RepID=UPI0016839FF9|nr:PLP-dependent aminotransferase family protein [Oscillatoria sp. FACHB-1406]MBD2577876.1 PLP-dependent aminotransferase family protein [Oscillatoria sp. FACHB-1406]
MNVKLPEKTDSKNLYEQVAERIEALILEGTLQPGDRLPSVRKLHHQLSVSISTVLEAYRLLEDRGEIGARPQSGYYVKANATAIPNEPAPSNPPKQVYPVDTSLAFRIRKLMHEPDIVQLGAAVPSPELFPIAALNRLMGQVMRSQPETVHGYDAPPGSEVLRREVAKRLMDAGCSLAPEEIVITNGTTESMYLSLKAVTKPGDTIAIESPSYYGLMDVFEPLYLNALELPTHPRDGICLDRLETALARKQIAACALVSNFSNPLGSCMSDAKKKQLVELLNRYDIPLIEDDVYGDLYFKGTRPKAIKAFDTEGRVLYCSSVSKTLSPGLRVGWSVPGRYQTRVEQLKIVTNVMTAIAPQLAVAAFFANGGCDRHLRRLRHAYQSQIARLRQAVCEHFPAQTRITRPEGGHVLWLELPPEFDSMLLYQEALPHRISIAPGAIFSPSGSYSNCLRLNGGLPWSDEIERALHILGELAKQQLARRQ